MVFKKGEHTSPVTEFKMGSIPWNKGKVGVYSEEVLDRMRNAKKGKHMSPNTEFKKGQKSWCKGIKGLYLGGEKGWFQKGHRWEGEIKERMQRNSAEKVLKRPILVMNENLSYIIGLLKGDGYVYGKNGHYKITLDITNKIIAANFYQALARINLYPSWRERMPTNGIGKRRKYIVIANSKLFCNYYGELECKTLRNKLMSQESIIGFTRGFYEAEGSLYVNKQSKTPTVSISNTDFELLSLVKDTAKLIGISFIAYGPYDNSRSFSNSKPMYRISCYSGEAKKFINLIKPCVKNNLDGNYG